MPNSIFKRTAAQTGFTKVRAAVISTFAALVMLSQTQTLAAQETDASCGAEGTMYICGPDAAEDMSAVPGTPWIIASSLFKGLYLINADEKSWDDLGFSTINDSVDPEGIYRDCPSPLKEGGLSSHGISIKEHENGQYRLYVVNHKDREAIEVFDINVGAEAPTLTWVGCVVAPAGTSVNSVVALTNGVLAVTQFFDPTDEEYAQKWAAQEPTGGVHEWSPNSGWTAVPNSNFSGTNGIEVSHDEEWYFITASFDNTFSKLPRPQNAAAATTIDLGFITDNIRWSADGSLIVAGAGQSFADIICQNDGVPCPADSSVVKIEPSTLAVETLATIEGTLDFHSASVAIEVDDALFVGTWRNLGKIAVVELTD